MTKVTPISDRKADHIRINLEEDVQSGLTTGLEKYRFAHRAVPEIDLDTVDPSISVFQKHLNTPILISSMTGGTSEAKEINRTLAIAAQETGVAMGLGSQRAALEHPALEPTFQVRKEAPDVLLFANLGAVQLNYGYTLDHCLRAIDMAEADALILHFNTLQEAVQPEGDTQFGDLIPKIQKICQALPVPVIAKEVGWGFSTADVRLLANAGIQAIDVAGAGGTSWTQVEMHRAENERQARLAAAFLDWGIPTAEAIQIVRREVPNLTVFASGGIRSGIDIAKCIALGASLGGMATPFLKAATHSVERTVDAIEEISHQLRVCMFAAGVVNINNLQEISLEKVK